MPYDERESTHGRRSTAIPETELMRAFGVSPEQVDAALAQGDVASPRPSGGRAGRAAVLQARTSTSTLPIAA